MDSRSNQPPFLGPTVPNYPVHTQVVRITGPTLGTSPGVYPAVVEQWAGADYRDREPCYVVVDDNVGRLVGSYNGLPLYGVGSVSASITITDWTNLTIILNNTTLNITDNVFFTFLVDNTFITITGDTTNLFILEVPLKIDSLLYLNAGTKTVGAGDLTDHGGGDITWDDWDTGATSKTVWRLRNAGGIGSPIVLTGMKPPTLPPGAPAGNGVARLLFNCEETYSFLLRDKVHSLAGSQFVTPDGFDLWIRPNSGVLVWYDPIDTVWRPVVEASGLTNVTTGGIDVLTNVSFDTTTCVVTKTFKTVIAVNGRVQSIA